MPIPTDFAPHDRSSPLTQPWEPIFARRGGHRLWLGIEVRAAHTNSRGLLHGGLIAALADNTLGLNLVLELQAEGRSALQGLVTSSLTVDFLGRAELGQWLEFSASFIHAGGTQGVAGGLVTADGLPIARANATFRFKAT